jgi:large subunit ribosomal protein L17
MRHRKSGRKLGVKTKHRVAMLRNMVTDLIKNGSIKTTDFKAKELRSYAERLITVAKSDTLHARRRAGAVVRDKAALKKLFDEVAPLYKERPGGYTRIVKLGLRRGDNAPVSLLELVRDEYNPKSRSKPPAKAKKPEDVKQVVSEKSSKKEGAEELGLVGDKSQGEEA